VVAVMTFMSRQWMV